MQIHISMQCASSSVFRSFLSMLAGIPNSAKVQDRQQIPVPILKLTAVAQRSAVFSSTLGYFMDSLLWEMSPPWSASLCCTLQSFIILQCFSDIHELFKHKIRKVRER